MGLPAEVSLGPRPEGDEGTSPGGRAEPLSRKSHKGVHCPHSEDAGRKTHGGRGWLAPPGQQHECWTRARVITSLLACARPGPPPTPRLSLLPGKGVAPGPGGSGRVCGCQCCSRGQGLAGLDWSGHLCTSEGGLGNWQPGWGRRAVAAGDELRRPRS